MAICSSLLGGFERETKMRLADGGWRRGRSLLASQNIAQLKLKLRPKLDRTRSCSDGDERVRCSSEIGVAAERKTRASHSKSMPSPFNNSLQFEGKLSFGHTRCRPRSLI